MKAYRKYRAWWMEHQAPSLVPSLYWGDNAEQAFEQHIKDMGLYQLMETLDLWDDEA